MSSQYRSIESVECNGCHSGGCQGHDIQIKYSGTSDTVCVTITDNRTGESYTHWYDDKIFAAIVELDKAEP